MPTSFARTGAKECLAKRWTAPLPILCASLCFTVKLRLVSLESAWIQQRMPVSAMLTFSKIIEAEGLGKWLIGCVMNHPALQGLRRFTLATHDAHGLYRRFGFRELSKSESKMEILRRAFIAKSQIMKGHARRLRALIQFQISRSRALLTVLAVPWTPPCERTTFDPLLRLSRRTNRPARRPSNLPKTPRPKLFRSPPP